MQKVSIGADNAYNKEFENFTTSKLFNRLQEKFRIKPYHEENKLLRKVVLCSSYLFNLFSIITSFYFAYSLLNSFLGLVLGLVLSVLMLTTLEGLKRLILPSIFKNYFQFKSKSYLKSALALSMVALSAFFSFHGAEVAIKEFTPSAEVATNEYSKIIGSKQEQQKELSKVKYKGTTTRTALRSIEAIQEEINELRGQESVFLTENKQRITVDKRHIEWRALILSLLAVIFDLSLIICLAYLEYYDYRSISEFATIGGKDTATVPTIEQNNDSTEVKELKKNEVSNDSQTIATNKKNCLNCEAVFDVSNPKKKFCSTSCRVKHWNDKNAKVLTVPTT